MNDWERVKMNDADRRQVRVWNNGAQDVLVRAVELAREEGVKDKDAAVEAEHMKTVDDMDEVLRSLQEENPHRFNCSIDYIRSRVGAEYAVRTTPPPEMVLVRMTQRAYDALTDSEFPPYHPDDIELVDPPGENESA